MTKERASRLLAVCLALLLICGCAAPAAEQVSTGGAAEEKPRATPVVALSPKAEEAAAPTPTPSPQERIEAAEEAFWRACVFESKAYDAVPLLTMAEVVARIDMWNALQEECLVTAKAAFLQAGAVCGEELGEFTYEMPGWKFFAALYHRFEEKAAEALRGMSDVAFTHDKAGKLCAYLRVGGDIRAGLSKQTPEQAFGFTLSYSYLNTIYGDEGNEKKFTQYALEEDYIRNLQDPLPGSHIKNGWYADRSKGTRKHTGTDIRSPEDTPILSCTAGVVLYIGYNEGAGNYVVVLDEAGLEYHYYHMVRLTDFLKMGEQVEKGQVVGHVGNTGNSTANHLHLTMVSPEFTYINPYYVLKEMRRLQ